MVATVTTVSSPLGGEVSRTLQRLGTSVPRHQSPRHLHLQWGQGKKGRKRVQRSSARLLWAVGHQSLNGKGQSSIRTPWPEARGQLVILGRRRNHRVLQTAGL